MYLIKTVYYYFYCLVISTYFFGFKIISKASRREACALPTKANSEESEVDPWARGGPAGPSWALQAAH